MARAALSAPFAGMLSAKAASLPVAVVVRTQDGRVMRYGQGSDAVELHVANPAGMRALRSLSELEICEAYIRGDLGFEGDLLEAMAIRDILSDDKLLIRLYARLLPKLIGRTRCNPSWIAKHYDSDNVQLLAADGDHQTYTPGIYDRADDTLEVGARRKLDAAFRSLALQPGDRVLDVGSGWGGLLRYCADRGVHATGITLSRHQLDYVRTRAEGDAQERLEVLYQDFFTYQPSRRYDGISLMGVMEDLSDYPRVMERVSRWVRPGGRIYCDFASADKRFSTSAFVTKYIWPGTFRMVYMPEFMEAIGRSSLDIVELHNDRRNYYLWSKALHERWVERRAEVVALAGEETWRMFRLLFAGVASIMSPSSRRATAYRLVLQERGSDA
jgi:cyclopropane-fatty-acyl-phospholipid synthase